MAKYRSTFTFKELMDAKHKNACCMIIILFHKMGFAFPKNLKKNLLER